MFAKFDTSTNITNAWFSMKNQVFYEELVLKVVYMSFAVLSMHGFL